MKKIKALKCSILFLLMVISFIACDKDFNVVESDVLGEENANFETDNVIIPIVAYNKKISSLQINNLASNFLGVFDDPAYGQTTSSIVTQVTPSSYNPNFGDNTVIDSIVVTIPYYSTITGTDDEGEQIYALDSLYGKPSNPIKLSIHQSNYFLRDFDPNTSVNDSQNYYSNESSASNSIFAGNTQVDLDNSIEATIYSDDNFVPSSDAIELWTQNEGDDEVTKTKSEPALRVVLQSPEDIAYWENTIINKEGTSVLSNTNNFHNYFRGLYIKAEPVNNTGSMILLNTGSTKSNVVIYYTKDSSIENERVQGSYVLNLTGNKLNPFINNYNLVTFPINPNKVLGDEKLYLKGASGSMAVVDLFPNGLEDFKNEFLDADGNPTRLINEAHLVVYEDETVETGGVKNYHRYDRVYAYDIKNNISTIDYLIDATENSQSPVSSKVISLSQRDTITGQFKIRLTEHLNNILLRDSTNTKIGLVLSTNVNYTASSKLLDSSDDVTAVPAAALLTPRGTILYGSNENVAENKRLALKIFYTEPNQP